MKPFRKTASVLLAFCLLFGLAGPLQAKETAAETPLMAIVGELLGVRYKYGGSTPKGMDCSGFVKYVFGELAGIELKRRSADQAAQGSKVDKEELREGDLVFFKTNGKSISHVGIYLGDGQFAHASSKKGITITPMNDSYYSKRYVTARRLLSDEEYDALASRAAAEERLAKARAAEEAAKREADGEETADAAGAASTEGAAGAAGDPAGASDAAEENGGNAGNGAEGAAS